MQRKKVDFPDPDDPISPTTSPCITVSDTLLSTSVAPKHLRTHSASTTVAAVLAAVSACSVETQVKRPAMLLGTAPTGC